MQYTRFPPGASVDDQRRPTAARAEAKAADTTDAVEVDATPLSIIIPIFLIACFLPLQPYNIGGLALTPARMAQLVFFLPALFWFVTGRAGRLRASDYLMFGFILWSSLALFVHGGMSLIEFIGISAIEFLTPYLLARTLIRTPAQYRQTLRICFVVVVMLAGAAAIEATTEFRVFNRIFDVVGRTYPPVPDQYERRLGMVRAEGTFQHPIMFGVVMSLFFAPFFYMRRRDGRQGGARRAFWSAMATFFSLSTGAWLSTMTQVGLMVWGGIFSAQHWRWKVLMFVTALGYVTIDLFSNRTPFEVFVSYMTLNTGTGYMRVLIFSYGMDNVWANPVFGLGLGDWERPSWMYSASVDNFWLLSAMRFGIPGFLFCVASYVATLIQLGRAKITDPAVAMERNGLVFALVGVALSICTVHLWGTSLYFLLFMWGAGGWMWDYVNTSAPAAAGPKTPVSWSGGQPQIARPALAIRR